MNGSTRVVCRPRRARPPAARTAAAIIVMAALALLATACGSSPSSTGSGGSSNAGGSVTSQAASSNAVAFSHCMRSHGVPTFPDPTRGGVPKVTPQQVGVSDSVFQAAQRACAQLLQPSQAQAPQIMAGMLNFARCMRSHGVPKWPDPTTDSTGQPIFNIPGINPDSPQVSNVADGCTHLLVGSTTATIQLCNGIGEDGGCYGYGEPSGS